MKKLMFALTLISMTSAYGMQNDPFIIKFSLAGGEFYRLEVGGPNAYVVGRDKDEKGQWKYWSSNVKKKAESEAFFNKVKKKYSEQEESRSVEMGNNDTEKS